ncbi:MAG: 50S ribosomal protein L9 [Deltaproteobacteria bacterium]|nr:50S ribosomal protein L9 [Deltaproteobacteria bacterium]
MEVILRQDLDELGLEGDIVNVAKGYARNYLMPKGLALEASLENINSLELQRKKIEVRRLNAKENAEKVKQQIEEMEITFEHKAGEEGKLYGSVTSMDIASHLESKGIIIDRKKIVLEKPIKELGEFEAKVKIYPEVTGEIKVKIVPEKGKEE